MLVYRTAQFYDQAWNGRRFMRIGGTVLILIGLAVLIGLSSLFYAPIPNVSAILVALGMPGVLLGALVGILCLGFGFTMMFAARGLRGWRAGRG